MAELMPTLLRLKVHPDSGKNRLDRISESHFEIWVKAKPEAGRATKAALALLAGALGVESKRLRVARGATSPNKIVEVLGT